MPDASSQAKSDRLKAALRENLKRRKAQARGRKATPEADSSAEGEPADRSERRTD
jgi:hypothetical protein